jgi:hypothetical protein
MTFVLASSHVISNTALSKVVVLVSLSRKTASLRMKASLYFLYEIVNWLSSEPEERLVGAKHVGQGLVETCTWI